MCNYQYVKTTQLYLSGQDVTGLAFEYPSMGVAMSGLLQDAQDLISGKKLF